MPPLNLKQRLAALPISPSSSSGQELRSSLSALKQKTKAFNPPWAKRQSHERTTTTTTTLGESGALQEAMSRMIFQAGVDFETRPMVVLNASALPDPQEVSYDLLLTRILSYFDLYVESDYTVVFFAAGVQNAPGWNWVWKAYRSLSRKYRKNLKQLYIIHPSFFSKMLFSLAGAIISPKFFRKLVYVGTLSQLATLVPITQIDIPAAVYQENLKHEQSITMPIPVRSNIFGVPLEELMGYDGEKGGLPRVVKDSVQYLRENGLLEEGIFRRSPSSVMLKAAQDAYDRGNVVSLKTFGDPHLAAVLLKKYLRDLPEPIFPETLYPLIRRCPLPTNDPADMASVTYIRETLLPSIPPCTYILLSHILNLMHEISLRSTSNRMDAHNLSIVLSPNLVKGSNPLHDVSMCAVLPTSSRPAAPTGTSVPPSATLGSLMKLCIERYFEIFDEVPDRSEAVAVGPSFQSSEQASTYDDESIDDGMLVMPIGPGGGGSGSGGGGGARYAHSDVNRTRTRNGSVGHPVRSRSIISIDSGAGGNSKTVGKKGTITLGRGDTVRKSSGSAVEAIGITAEGFFTSPSKKAPPPPVPPRLRNKDIA